jgi:NAD-reducing hydrogenase small subunit
MSLLDMDERLLDIAQAIDLVYSPLMDIKAFPEGVDIALVEGAVANEDNLAMLQLVRSRSTVLVAFGDCAVTGNVTALRNPLGRALPVIQRAYGHAEHGMPGVGANATEAPPLLDRVRSLRGFVPVDYYLPGCPPPADLIFYVLSELVAGHRLDLRNRATLG